MSNSNQQPELPAFIELTSGYFARPSAITSVWFSEPCLDIKPKAIVAVRASGDVHVIDPDRIAKLRALVAPPRVEATLPAPVPAPTGDFYEAQAKARQ